jgi:hypothetical protein
MSVDVVDGGFTTPRMKEGIVLPIKKRLGTLIAMLTVAGALAVPSAHAATPSCGSTCIDLFNQLYGKFSVPKFVVGVLGKGENVGQVVALTKASATASEDFTLSVEGTVADFIAAGLIAQGMSIYNSLEGYEIEYAPDGVDTGLCVGVGATPANGTRVALEPCGVSSKTVWIPNTSQRLGSSYTALINGATDSNFSSPQVLSGLLPYLTLYTSSLHTTRNGSPFPTQSWGADFGVLPTTG